MNRLQFTLFSALILVAVGFSSVATYFVLAFGSFSGASGSASVVERMADRSSVVATPVASLESVKDLETSVKTVAGKIAPSVVSITITRDIEVFRNRRAGTVDDLRGTTIQRKIGGGTGIFVTKDGLVLTNKHVVSERGASYTATLDDGSEYPAKVVALDPTSDLAVVQVYDASGAKLAGVTPAEFAAEGRGAQIGSFVLALGNSLAEFQNTLTFGIVSGLERTIEAGEEGNYNGSSDVLSGLIQTDAAINPGNSGGPLVGLDGTVFGVNTAIVSGANGIGFAIPVSRQEIEYLLESLNRYGQIKRSFLGVYYTEITPDAAGKLGVPEKYGYLLDHGDGANDSAVVSKSPAEAAGIKTGDVLLSVDGVPLKSLSTLKERLRTKFPGDSVSIALYRPSEKRMITVSVKLTEA